LLETINRVGQQHLMQARSFFERCIVRSRGKGKSRRYRAPQ
jgi:hypothetical protein